MTGRPTDDSQKATGTGGERRWAGDLEEGAGSIAHLCRALGFGARRQGADLVRTGTGGNVNDQAGGGSVGGGAPN
jgi:hypothetical protein